MNKKDLREFEDDKDYYETYVPSPQVPSYASYSPRMDRADFVAQIKPDQLVENMRHRLMGEEFNGTVWVKVEALKEIALTDKGAWEISNMMLSVSSINVSISKLDKSQIKERLRYLMKELFIKMLSNTKAYGIKNVGQMYYVKSIVFSNSLVVLNQAGDGSIQELLKTNVSENRNINTDKKEAGKLKRMLGMG